MKKISFVLAFLSVICLGLSFGIGVFTFYYGQGAAYLSNDPKACVNCHIMQDQYNSWIKSSHGKFTTCNSCHAPQNFFLKYLSKAENGFNHSLKFTTGNFKDPIEIRSHNKSIVLQACLNCHASLFSYDLNHKVVKKNNPVWIVIKT